MYTVVWGSFHQVAGTYYWSDKWHVVYTKWGQDQPSKPEGGGCVEMDAQGYWADSECSQRKRALCKITSGKNGVWGRVQRPHLAIHACDISTNRSVYNVVVHTGLFVQIEQVSYTLRTIVPVIVYIRLFNVNLTMRITGCY